MGLNFLWIILTALALAIYFFLIKSYVNNRKLVIIVLIILLALLLVYLYCKSLQQGSSGLSFAIIKGLSIVLVIFIAVFIFEEKISLNDLMGVFLIVLGIIIVSCKSNTPLPL